MAAGAVLAAALTNHAARAKSLWLNGTDVLTNGPLRGNTFGTPIGSITVEEAACGQVSRLSCAVTDPAGELVVAEGMEAFYFDHDLDLPIFRGWVESWQAERLGIGRRVELTCVGVESWLDWLYIPPLTLPAGISPVAGFQSLAQGAPLRAAASQGDLSTQAVPIALGLNPAFVTTAAWSWEGGTLRQALQSFGDWVATDQADWGQASRIVATVDFDFGLRIMRFDHGTPGGGSPAYTVDDVFGPIISTTLGGAPRPSNTHYGVNAAGVPRAVYVIGANAAGTGFVPDGSGIPGRTAVVNDPNSTTAALRQAIGLAYLAGNAVGTAGDVTTEGSVDMGTRGNEVRAWGAVINLSDPQAGATGVDLVTTSISKRFHAGGDEDWSWAFGGETRRLSHVLRRLTADVQR